MDCSQLLYTSRWWIDTCLEVQIVLNSKTFSLSWILLLPLAQFSNFSNRTKFRGFRSDKISVFENGQMIFKTSVIWKLKLLSAKVLSQISQTKTPKLYQILLWANYDKWGAWAPKDKCSHFSRFWIPLVRSQRSNGREPKRFPLQRWLVSCFSTCFQTCKSPSTTKPIRWRLIAMNLRQPKWLTP